RSRARRARTLIGRANAMRLCLSSVPNFMTRSSLTCSARIGMQADAVRLARTMVRETPASHPSPSPGGRGERRVRIDLWSNTERSIVGILAVLAAAPAAAQSYPERGVSVVVAFPAAGATDHMARLLAQRMTELWS